MSTIATETKRPTIAPVELKDLFEHDVYSMIVDKLEERDAVMFFTSTKARFKGEGAQWFCGKFLMYQNLLLSAMQERDALGRAEYCEEYGTPEYNILRREMRAARQVTDELMGKVKRMQRLLLASSKMKM